ncbi:MAG: hypothetical protein IJO44_05740 [Clostridia bacterium]|nr:hypothetical protein [Clostridia bacterium]
MIRIVCTKCKNAYLQNKDDSLVCPSCEAVFSSNEENLLLGVQYYNEGSFNEADNCLMKYIVKNGAEPKAIIYKALCDGYSFDEDMVSLKDTYEKILEALGDISDDELPAFIAIANDEAKKLEIALTEAHVRLFADADAEKIKKQVATVLDIQKEARAFRSSLIDVVNDFNGRNTIQLSVKFSDCFFVSGDIAAEVGNIKYQKICDNIAAHTVFTGILSNDIKNLEIYYRCIVMFFEKSHDKYEFLLREAAKFTELAEILEQGQYNTIKGTAAIGTKLKSISYEFLEESYKEHFDENINMQTETVVIIEPEIEVVEEVAENIEDISSTDVAPVAEENTEITEADVDEAIELADEEEASVIEVEEETAAEVDTADTVDAIVEVEAVEETEAEAESNDEAEEATEAVIEIDSDEKPSEEAEETVEVAEATEAVEEASIDAEAVEATEEVIAEEATEETSEDIEEEAIEEALPENTDEEAEVINEEEITEAEKTAETKEEFTVDASNVIESEIDITEAKIEKPKKKKKKKKKSKKGLVVVLLIILVIGAVAGYKYIPGFINDYKYNNAVALFESGKFDAAAVAFAELNDYKDSEDKRNESIYSKASKLEDEKKFNEAITEYKSLGDYKDCDIRIQSCTYSQAKAEMDEGNFDEATKLFKAIAEYGDSSTMITECTYRSALKHIENKEVSEAIELLNTIADYSDAQEKINEAKYVYVTENFDAENETTVAYLNELTLAKYRNSEELRTQLLGSATVTSDKIKAFVNYSTTDMETALTELDNGKTCYFHVVVEDEALYGQRLSIKYRTAFGYTQSKSVYFSAEEPSTYVSYPPTKFKNYEVTFQLVDDNGNTLAEQVITF